ncbi:DMT family transporter [Brochothrix campestris]|uniref:EamA family transporter n=1 Tax=Brochothrix campestris FSL F6-1037 TaxID=1265861 RepID=W7CY16_9LIST|nr:DMT family transporter [Brochothrix campestris]EUJ41827.1 EamA family transporter [Brochothrix campestris FSL F6-1037]
MNKKALLQLIIAMAIFGSIGFFSRLTGLAALELIYVRAACASVFLLFVWFITGSHHQERWLKKELLLIALCGVSNLCNWIFLFKAFEVISITVAISLYHIGPILMLVVGAMIYREKLTRGIMLAMLACFIGTIFIMGTDVFSAEVPNWQGIIYGLLAAVFYAVTMLFGATFKQTSVYMTTLIQMVVAVVLLTPFIAFDAYNSLTQTQWFYALLTGIVHTGIVYLLLYTSIRQLSPTIVSFSVFVDPAVAILLDIIITGFMPSSYQIIGIGAIFVGLLYSLFPRYQLKI